jgi:hypothetical protein
VILLVLRVREINATLSTLRFVPLLRQQRQCRIADFTVLTISDATEDLEVVGKKETVTNGIANIIIIITINEISVAVHPETEVY